MNSEKKIKSDVPNIVNEILAAETPSHYLIIYGDLLSFREIYTQCKRELL